MALDIDRPAAGIRLLAQEAVDQGSFPGARKAARAAIARPVDYMRCAEFDAILSRLRIRPGARILDVGSPQWFSLYLARLHPEATFTYSNIIERELTDYREIARACRLTNIRYVLEDARKLTFADAAFDQVVTISVIEHVFPESGGDVQALREIRRVLAPAGRVHLTVPCKAAPNVVYLNGPVYERGGGERVFFAREYDRETFFELVKQAGFEAQSVAYISERPGLLALDRLEWGPWSSRWSRYGLAAIRLAQERVIGRSWDRMLAQRYLRVTEEPQQRLVNVAAVLSPGATPPAPGRARGQGR